MAIDSDILAAIAKATNKDLAVSVRTLAVRKKWDVYEAKACISTLRALYPQIKGYYRPIKDGKGTISQETVYYWDSSVPVDA